LMIFAFNTLIIFLDSSTWTLNTIVCNLDLVVRASNTQVILLVFMRVAIFLSVI